MSSGRDLYEVLGVERNADPQDIKRAFKKLAIQYHPDRNPDDPAAEEKFKEASQAYAVLSDDDKRARYDRLGHAAFGSAGGGFEQVDFNSMGEMLEGFLGDILGRRKGRGPRDLTYELQISFVEAAVGCEKKIEVKRPTLCDTCKGTGAAPGTNPKPCQACAGRGAVKYQRGFFAASRPCGSCGGTGRLIESPCATCKAEGTVERPEEMTVRIPAGVDDGSVRTVKGGGEQTPNGSGDLHVFVRVQPHPLFTRDGADLLCTIPIAFPHAVLGTQLEVPTLEGMVRMKLPPGTQSGKIFRLRGKGIPVFGGAGKGDQLVKVVVEVPEKVNRKQRKLLEQLADEMGTDTLPQRQTFLSKLRELFD